MSTEIERVERARHRLQPLVDVFENDDGVLLRADLPGVTAEGLDVQLDHGVLTIVGTRALPEHRGGGHVEFRRRFQVPRYTDPGGITAHLDRGVLSVTLPKAEAARPRTIPITRG